VGAFKEKANAKTMLHDLEKLGFSVHLSERAGFFRVIVGFDNNSAARDFLKHYRNRFHIPKKQ
jgi:hypothetical protein